MAEGWIEDHLGILANQYLTLMQVKRLRESRCRVKFTTVEN